MKHGQTISNGNVAHRTVAFGNFLFRLSAWQLSISALLIILLPSVSHAAFSDYGRSATMTSSFFIGSSVAGDAVTAGNNYIIAEDRMLFGLSSGSAFGTRSLSDSTHDIIQLRQPLEGASFVIFFTNSSNASYSSFYPSNPEIPRATVGPSAMAVQSASIFVRLVYPDVDIVGNARWVSGIMKLRFVNQGKSYQNLPQVDISLIG